MCLFYQFSEQRSGIVLFSIQKNKNHAESGFCLKEHIFVRKRCALLPSPLAGEGENERTSPLYACF
jgi:hypothetical protein